MNAWPHRTLDQVAEIERDMIQPEDIQPGIRYVGLEHIVSGGELLNTEIVENSKLRSTKFRFSAEHILYGKLRPYLAKIAAPSFAGVCSTEIIPIRPGPTMDRNFLLHFLRQPSQIALATARSSGANLPRLSPSKLAKFIIPVPSLPEQHRIAAILDQADALHANRRAALAQLDDMAQAIFVEMFGNPTANAQAIPTKPLEKLGRISTGATPSSSRSGMFGGDVPFITPGDLGSNEPARRTVTAEGAEAARTVRGGAALVCCIGATIGKVDKASRWSAFNQQINAVEWNNQIDDEYGFRALTFFKERIASLGTSTTLPILNKSAFSRIELPVPEIGAQKVFARRMTAVQAVAARHHKGALLSDILLNSLQHRAFTGAL